jgi:hypothetical protein
MFQWLFHGCQIIITHLNENQSSFLSHLDQEKPITKFQNIIEIIHLNK